MQSEKKFIRINDEVKISNDKNPVKKSMFKFLFAFIIASLFLLTAVLGGILFFSVVMENDNDNFRTHIQNIGGANFEFVSIPSGSFSMGSPFGEGRTDEYPQHNITITKEFEIMKFEVTQYQWKSIMKNNPSLFFGMQNPVDSVSWNDCQEFIDVLNYLDSNHTYRLPTEAEWEYCCRAGSVTKYFFGNDEAKLVDYAWCRENTDTPFVDEECPHKIGLKKPNKWGLYDMYGNVLEWCSDWYDQYYYTNSSEIDPKGPENGDRHVIRGGCWYSHSGICRSGVRFYEIPDAGDPESTGFRLVRTES